VSNTMLESIHPQLDQALQPLRTVGYPPGRSTRCDDESTNAWANARRGIDRCDSLCVSLQMMVSDIVF
jgi:hypothetical protein